MSIPNNIHLLDASAQRKMLLEEIQQYPLSTETVSKRNQNLNITVVKDLPFFIKKITNIITVLIPIANVLNNSRFQQFGHKKYLSPTPYHQD
jgi:hypothetical protein